ncbi:conserved hypothetical protein [Paraglaciecola sp. T6c]|uniref:glycosyltransferase family 2 protein n=1 Tax=Pseudoalteromonas atlantica (strain T6c / ATCC BAA-1087) TaxID=3042615 RepID=UPI00005C5EF4|nr:glycosyltransferase family A protein [Paraglaciecola sp. T6c]ABG41727.1 conserved hypothetical protein [Paraglaciecola sp. T6c]
MQPTLSIVSIFHNMQREAKRTLFSFSAEYQQGITDVNYEVIAIDNASSEPLDKVEVEALGEHYSYHYFKTDSVSPVDAINYGASLAKGKYLMVLIDGARILSPGVIASAMRIAQVYDDPFIYTLGLHLGPDIQNRSIVEGYCQSVEDDLLTNIDWQNNGYRLFDIAALAGSSAKGFSGPIAESNCFIMPLASFRGLGGMNTAFQTPGGGLVNLDFFQQACHAPSSTPILLLGEGSFHQIHGGVATNVKQEEHPMPIFEEEYQRIYGKPWVMDTSISPTYFGKLPANCQPFLVV